MPLTRVLHRCTKQNAVSPKSINNSAVLPAPQSIATKVDLDAPSDVELISLDPVKDKCIATFLTDNISAKVSPKPGNNNDQSINGHLFYWCPWNPG